MRLFKQNTYLKAGLLLLSFQFLFYNPLIAQHWEIGAGAGFTNYRGDVSLINLKNTSEGSHIFAKYNFDEAWSIRTGFMFMKIGANDQNSDDPIAQARQFSFTNSVTQFYIAGEYNFLNFRNEKERIKFTTYFTAGLGYFRYNDYGYVRSGDGYSNISVPFGIGFKYKLTENLNLNGEYIANKTFTSGLDNLNADSPAYLSTHLKGDNPSTDDWFFYSGLSISYIFRTIKCPGVFRY